MTLGNDTRVQRAHGVENGDFVVPEAGHAEMKIHNFARAQDRRRSLCPRQHFLFGVRRGYFWHLEQRLMCPAGWHSGEVSNPVRGAGCPEEFRPLDEGRLRDVTVAICGFALGQAVSSSSYA